MSCKIYQHDKFSTTIYYYNNEIIINILDELQNNYENIITNENLNKICIFNFVMTDVDNYYNFLTNAFENTENYEIFFANNNSKYMRVVVKEKTNDCFTIKNVLWVKIKKNDINDFENRSSDGETTNILHNEYYSQEKLETNKNTNTIQTEDKKFSIFQYIIDAFKKFIKYFRN